MTTRKDVSIRKKILLAVGASILLLFVAMYFISSQVLEKSYIEIEREGVVNDIRRAIDAINNSSDLQLIKLADWSSWDESYNFVVTKDPEFVETNLKDPNIVNLDLDAVLYFDTTGDVVLAREISHETGTRVPSDDLVKTIEAHPQLLTHPNLESKVGGFFMMPEGPFMIASRPLIKSDGTGPTTGTMMFGRFFDSQRVQDIADLTHIAITVFPYASTSLPQDVQHAKENLSDRAPFFVNPLSNTTVVGYSVLRDLDDKPMLIVRVEEPRPIFAQGTLSLYLFMGIAAFAILLFGLIVLLLLERLIIARFVSLTKQVDKINNEHDITLQIRGGSNDDIGRLTEKINQMLGWLGESKTSIEKLLLQVKTEKNKAEDMVVQRTRELREEKARLLASINSLSFGFIIADTNDAVLVRNPAIMSILELKKEPKSVSDIVESFKGVSDSIDVLSHSCKECIALKQTVELKEISYGKKFLRVFCTPIMTKETTGDRTESTVIGYAMLIEDITEAKVMERSREEFFAVASHELRTPLTAIRGNADMILDMYADKIVDKDMKEMLTDIDASSVRLISIVNDFLEVSRLEQGKAAIHPETFDISECIEKVVRDLSGSIAEKGLTLTNEIKRGSIPSVNADKNQTEEILMNLIGNAMKFTQKGNIQISAEHDGAFVRVRVTDTGVGISEHNQALLFRKFQQAGEQMLARDVTQSTGLGLYISRLIISNMGGTIGLEKSELGKGSTFSFTLPIAKT